jgi:hypothetical protein
MSGILCKFLPSENAGNLECIYITLSINGQTTENANLEMHGEGKSNN